MFFTFCNELISIVIKDATSCLNTNSTHFMNIIYSVCSSRNGKEEWHCCDNREEINGVCIGEVYEKNNSVDNYFHKLLF